MKRLLLTILYLISLQVGYSQGEALIEAAGGDMEKALENASPPDKAEIFLFMADSLTYSDPKRAISLTDSVIYYFQISNQADRIPEALAIKLSTYDAEGKDRSAVNIYESNLEAINALNYDDTHLRILGTVGSNYGRIGQPQKGLPLLLDIYERARADRDTLRQISYLRKMAAEVFNRDQASILTRLDTIVHLAENFSGITPGYMATLMHSRGAVFMKMGDLEAARRDLERAQVILDQAAKKQESGEDVDEDRLFVLFLMGELFLMEGEVDSARSYFETSAQIGDTVTGTFIQAMGQEARSHALLLEGKSDSSRQAFDAVVRTMEELGDQEMVFEMLLTRSRLLKGIGNYEQALEAIERMNAVKDSMITNEQAQIMEEMRAMNQTENVERDNELLRLRNEAILQEKNNATRTFIIVMALVLLSALIFVFLFLRTRRLSQSISRQNTRLADQNDRLVQLTKDNELLVGIVAHDLKAPLVKVQSLLHMIVQQNEIKPESQPLISMADRVIEGGQQLVSDILVLSELGRGSTPELEKQALGPLIENSLADFQNLAQRKNIELVAQPPGEPASAPVHAPYLHRIMDNLVSNALKFSKPGTQVTVAWGTTDGRAWCTITDQGPGIPPEEQGQLFQRFARLSNRPTGNETSSGLGLYIVKTLLKANRATISFQSKVGVGTTFRIDFPAT